MATYNSTNIKFEYDVTSGGALADYTADVDKIGNQPIKNNMKENTPFGTAYPTKSPTGLIVWPPFDVEGEFNDDAAKACMILRGARADKTLRTVKLTFGGTKTISSECYISAFEVIPQVDAVSRFKATIDPSGTVTEA